MRMGLGHTLPVRRMALSLRDWSLRRDGGAQLPSGRKGGLVGAELGIVLEIRRLYFRKRTSNRS